MLILRCYNNYTSNRYISYDVSKNIKLNRGFDIKVAGKATKNLVTGSLSSSYAIKPTDFLGVERPKVVVQKGDLVKAGSPIFFDKKNDKVKITSPVSGEIAEVIRGEKNVPLEVRIIADTQIEYVAFKKYTLSELNSVSNEIAINALCESGVFANFIQRPFGTMARPEDKPKAIHVSTFDTAPLAADVAFTLKGDEKYFAAGVEILKKLSKKVNINTNAGAELTPMFSETKGVNLNAFTGKHPTGNVGVQIHHIDPINKGEIVWTVSAFGVAQIGKLFLEGKYDASKVIAVAGSEVTKPQYYKTFTGACINKLVENNLNSQNVRFISGNILTGEKISQDGYLNFYHNSLSVLPEGNYYDFLGWISPLAKTSKSLSFQRAFGLFSFLAPQKEYVLDTNTHGEERAFVQTGVYEEVLPMDILPAYLLKAILANDYDAMEELGIYEMIEEDIALCEFVDVSKMNMQKILREGLDMIQNS